MERPDAPSPSWTSDELAAIDADDELRIAARKRDGALRAAVPIWAVRVDDALYVRAAYGPRTGWYRVARANGAAHVSAGGVERDVTTADADAAVNDAVDAAYRAKYGRYADSIVDGIVNAQARATTIELRPAAA